MSSWPRNVLFATLGLWAAAFLWIWAADIKRRGRAPDLKEVLIGLLTDFLDTLGIGSFAPTTSIFKLLKVAPDEDIPGTLNIGHALPTLAEAFIFIAIVSVSSATLVLMILSSVLGAWLGAGIVASWPRRKIQIGMGAALLTAAVFFLMSNLDLFPLGGSAEGLSGVRLLIGGLGSFIFGALMTLGIGNYAPSMILFSLLGMNPAIAFPIMMGSDAFLMPIAGLRFIRKARYAPGPALGLTLGGVVGVFLAAYIVKSLPLKLLRWLVVGVVVYTAVVMLRSAYAEKPEASARAA